MNPQAQLPTYNRGTRLLSSPPGAQAQPRPIVLNGTDPVTVFDTAYSNAYGDRVPLKKLVIRNDSNVKIYWAKNTVASASVYHGILKAGTATKDGTGGEIDLSADQPTTVSLFAAAAATAVLDVIYEENL